MNRIFFIIFQFVVFAVILETTGGFGVNRRSAAPDRGSDDYPDYQLGVKYDEYPMIVPKKRTALLVNRLMIALKEAIDEEEQRNQHLKYDVKDYPGMTPDDIRSVPSDDLNIDYDTCSKVKKALQDLFGFGLNRGVIGAMSRKKNRNYEWSLYSYIVVVLN